MNGSSTSLRVPSPQVTQNNIIPAPIQGMNAALNISEENPQVCIWCENIIPSEYGLRVREGYRVWAEGINNGATPAVAETVRTMITYYGRTDAATPTADRIFAVSSTGIWDVTTVGAAPTLVETFASINTVSGYGVWIQYVTEAGADLIFYADEENGLFTYVASTDTWAPTAGITTAAGSANTFAASDIAFIVNHKLRLWLIPKGANYAWYLPIRSIAGDAEEFFFGQKFPHGGDLVGLYNWTVDGGAGRDDNLVAVSRGGDVIPYTGEDPSDTLTWTTTGTFFVGNLPDLGRKLAAEHGGELFILSSFGVTTISDLLQGGNPLDPFRNKIGYRISRLLRQDIATDYRNARPWEISFLTDQGLLLITAPKRTDDTYRQYSYTLSTSGWGIWKDVPIISSAMFRGHLMVGDPDGRVLRMDRPADDIQIDGSGKKAIKWTLLSSYSTLGAPGLFKRVKIVRPNFVAERRPAYEITAYYDYRQDEPPPTTEPVTADGDVWDTGEWDTAIWGTSIPVPWHRPVGVYGLGRAVAIGMAGASLDSTFLASWDIAWDTGGFL